MKMKLTKDERRQALRAAASYVLDVGLTKRGSFKDENTGEVCALGALMEVCDDHFAYEAVIDDLDVYGPIVRFSDAKSAGEILRRG